MHKDFPVVININGNKYTALSINKWCNDNNMIRDKDFMWYMITPSTIIFKFKSDIVANKIKEIFND